MTGTAPPQLGDSFGRYQILSLISAGADRSTYAAHDSVLGREVTLIVVSLEASGDDEVRAEVMRTTSRLAALDSPHIPRVHEHGDHDGRLFVVVQPPPRHAADPADLEALVRERGLPPAPLALDIARQLATALSAAHRVDVTHGSLTPAQVKLRRGVAGWHVHLDGFFDSAAHPGEAAEPETDQRSFATLLTWLVPDLATTPAYADLVATLHQPSADFAAIEAALASLTSTSRSTAPPLTAEGPRRFRRTRLTALAGVLLLVLGVGAWGLSRVGLSEVSEHKNGPVEGDAAPPNLGPRVALTPGPLKSISVGGWFTCVLRPDDSGECFGDNRDGQLTGDRTLTRGPVPTPVEGPWATLTAGSRATCGVRLDSTAVCWGRNFARKFGDALQDNQIGIWDLPGRDWLTVVPGSFETCGLKTDGSATCWSEYSPEDTRVSALDGHSLPARDWVQIANDDDRCARDARGQLLCWGSTLGRETLDGDSRKQGVEVPGTWLDVSVSESAACGVRSDHALACWGSNNSSGVLGATIEDLPETVEPHVLPGDNWKQVDIDYDVSCALNLDGEIYCWGSNYKGNLGDGSGDDSVTPVQVPGGPYASVSVGGDTVCAMGEGDSGSPESETAWCWGDGWGETPERVMNAEDAGARR